MPLIVTLDKMDVGRLAVIKSVSGGKGMVSRMEALGVRPGKLVNKVSAQFWGGPITVTIDGRSLAIGRGLAARVFVELPDHE